MVRIAVLGSGRGSNFKAILDAIHGGRIPNVTVSVVISNNSDAGILETARANGLPAVHLSGKQFPTEEAFADALLRTFSEHNVHLIVLAGYMKLLHLRVIRQYRNRIVNIHPALLPKFGGRGMYGMRVHEAVLAAGEKFSGATVHLVDEEYDRGAIIMQRSVPVTDGDTPESLAAKVLRVEHEIYPEALRLFAEGNVVVPDNESVVHHS